MEATRMQPKRPECDNIHCFSGASAKKYTPEEAMRELMSSPETILDDTEVVGSLTAKQMEDAGYTNKEAATIQKAFEIFRKKGFSVPPPPVVPPVVPPLPTPVKPVQQPKGGSTPGAQAAKGKKQVPKKSVGKPKPKGRK